ncbi:hypothetical protein BDR05DRAFT_978825 [Suillus weaverae]|nr:hypothetical protein BDR05DRAFT_978825 [Suillus weaverae]
MEDDMIAEGHHHIPGPDPSVSELPPYPFLNMTVYRLMMWMNSGSHQKSQTEDVIQAKDFNQKDLDGFSVRRCLRTLDNHTTNKESAVFPDDWVEADINIDIPTKTKDEQSFSVLGFHYRPLAAVIHSAFADIQANAFRLFPFKHLWKDPLDNQEQHVFDELYTSDSWLEAQDNLQQQPKELGCSLERVIAGLMFFSDATHLANFGTAKAWPLYLYFGNLSKYARSSPTSGACHLVGFFPSLLDSIKDVLSNLPRISKTGILALQTHCQRELFQGCWNILLDAEFISAYRHGLVLRCPDGISRRVFPRIFTYSADYPEKVLIATIKDMGSCPCPHCFVLKVSFGFLGLFRDMRDRVASLRAYSLARVSEACDLIYQWGNTVDGSKVQMTLRQGSWVPTMNALVDKLGPLGFDAFRILVVDFMHECELGTWKALFVHLVHLLYALPGGDGLVARLDNRFRQVPSYGNGVIRRFANNTSEMKRLATRDFENILQCAMPVFEGLFPADHDVIVQSLLYRFVHWHALAKLRVHTESMLSVLDETFKKLSHQLCKFHDFTCAAFTTTELLKERAARERKATREPLCPNDPDPGISSQKAKKFNLNTYKFHAMGDYVRSIRLFGTTDSFTTQIGELAHRALKAFYPLTNKLDTPTQLATHEHRRHVLRRIAESGQSSYAQANKDTAVDAPLAFNLKHHHYIPTLSHNHPLDLFRFLRQHDNDPAVAVGMDISYCDHMFTDDEHSSVVIPDNKIYSVQTMQYDTINPRTHSDIMVLSGETKPQHPYWYAHVLGIYHMDVRFNIEGSMKMRQVEVLYVTFIEESDRDAFGTHLIPAFASGRGTGFLCHGKFFARQGDESDDWEAYYIGIFVDRDMFMCYTQHGIGHPTVLREMTRDCINAELADSPDCDLDSDSEDVEDIGCESDSEDTQESGAESEIDEDGDNLEMEVEEEEEDDYDDEHLSF